MEDIKKLPNETSRDKILNAWDEWDEKYTARINFRLDIAERD